MTLPVINSVRKREPWIAAGVLWLAVMYVASVGPAIYAVRRGWLSMPVAQFVYMPLDESVKNMPGVQDALGWYLRWWRELP